MTFFKIAIKIFQKFYLTAENRVQVHCVCELSDKCKLF